MAHEFADLRFDYCNISNFCNVADCRLEVFAECILEYAIPLAADDDRDDDIERGGRLYDVCFST